MRSAGVSWRLGRDGRKSNRVPRLCRRSKRVEQHVSAEKAMKTIRKSIAEAPCLLTLKSLVIKEKSQRNQEVKRHQVAEAKTPPTPAVARTTENRGVASKVIWRSDRNERRESSNLIGYAPISCIGCMVIVSPMP
jgi:hypothetical protein